jgi:poly(3-hydroxybutyrate) depolymerase
MFVSSMGPRTLAPVVAVMLAITLAGGCSEPHRSSPTLPLPPGDQQKVPADTMELVLAEFAAARPVELLVVFAPPPLDGASAASFGSDDFRIIRMATVKADLQRALGPELVVQHDYEQLPIQLVTIGSSATMTALLADDRVLAVDQVRFAEASLTESLALIGQPAAVAEGKTGAGTAVAVIDTGVDFTRAAFGSCTAVNAPQSTCRVVHAQDFGTDDGARDVSPFHGTNVAGIVAGTAPDTKIIALDVFNGTTASSTAILDAINFVIQNKTTFNIAAMNLSLGTLNGTSPFTSPCNSEPMAVAVANARTAGILASVATGNHGFTNGTGAPACGAASVSVAAVYDAANFSISCPAGGTETAAVDRVTCFSNTASFTTLVAPGAAITAAGITMQGTSQASPHVAGAIAVLRASFPNETPDAIVSRLTNTGTDVTRGALTFKRLNLAAAASGCVFGVTPTRIDSSDNLAHTESFALTTGAACGWQVSTTGGFFTVSPASGTGPATLTVAMQANSGAVRGGSLTVAASSGTTATERTVFLSQGTDTAPPTGTVTINAGATTTRVAAVALSITADDPSGVPLMCVTQSTTCSLFEPLATSKTVTLSATGNREVRVFLRDSRGNTSTATSAPKDAIIFDNVAPTGGALTVAPGIAQLNLTWTAATDALAGVEGYRIFTAENATPPACSSTTTPVAQTTELVRTASVPATNGASTQVRVCPVDRAGNVGTGFTGAGIARSELAPPTGTISIASPTPGYTRVSAVTVAVTANDPSNVTGVCVSTATSCSTFTSVTPAATFSGDIAFTLPATAGLKTVNLFLRDGLGNVTTSPAATASITFDATPPTVGAVAATPGDGQVTLSVASVTDSPAGVAAFRVVYAEGTLAAPPAAPTSCATGTAAGDFPATPLSVTGLTNRTLYAFRVCAVDRAGNVSAGATRSAEPRREFTPPAAVVSINAGAVATNSATLTVGITVTENEGVESLCIGFTATACATFELVDPVTERTAALLSRTVTLPTTTAGTRSVFVTLRDTSGNTMATPASDSIILDQVAPTGGTLKVTPGNASAVIAWTAPTDAPAGLLGYRLRVAEGTAPATCGDGVALGDETTLRPPQTSFAQSTGLNNGTTYGWRLCPVDRAGNVAAGLAVTGQPRAEFAPPTASVVINDGATFTNSTAVILRITGADPSGVASYCASNVTGTCSPFEAFTTSPMSVPFTLTNTAGARTVFVTLRDNLGNTMTSPASDGITLDTTAPTGGTLTVASLVASLRLTWTASADANGVAGYQVFADASAIADCTGTPLTTVTTTAFTESGLQNGVARFYRVCPVDRAGNVGVGFAGSGTPRAELVGPVGTVLLNDGALFTNAATLNVKITATDPSGVNGLCLAATATACTTTFDAYDGTEVVRPFTVTSTAGVKTVFVALRDTLGNVATTSKTITMDLTGPTGGALTFTIPSANAVQLAWTAAADPAGIREYRVFASATATPPPDCSGTPLATTTAAVRTFLHTGLTGGSAVGYRVCPVDTAGNVGAGFTGVATPRVEVDPPTGSVVINTGAAATNNNVVQLTITAADTSGLGAFCARNDATACTTFTPMTASPTTVAAFTMTNTVGTRTVFVTLRDALGNTTTTPVSDTIVLDRTAPSATTLTASPSSTDVSLSWSATDPVGIRAFKLVFLSGATAPAVKCTTGTTLSSNAATSFVHSGLAAGTFTYRLCPEDNAGNVGDGVTRSVTIRVPGAPSAGCGRALVSTDFKDTTGDGNPETETTLVVAGRTRRAAIRVPAGYDPTFPHAIVYELHGDQDAGFTPDPSTFTQGIFGADEYGGAAIVIALRGENILAPIVRDDFAAFVSWDTLTAPPGNLDIEALRAFRTYVEDRACVETGKVFAVGFSGGGFLAQTMRCFGEDFRAVANFQSGLDLPAYDFLRDDSGAFLHIDTTQCATTAIPQLVVHLTGDTTVVPAQGIDTADFWATRHGCSARASATASALNAACVEYAACGVDEDVVLCTPSGGGHEVWSPDGASVLQGFFNRFF